MVPCISLNKIINFFLMVPLLLARRAVFEMVLGSSTTFGFGLCLDAWQTLGVLFSYLNSVALALMLAGVIYKVARQDYTPEIEIQ